MQVWDYRSSLSKLGDNDSSGDEFPKVQKACLRMGMENVVKDLPSILDASWSYNDILVGELGTSTLSDGFLCISYI